MGSYQIYDFYKIDRPLSKEERRKIIRLSSRVEPSNHQATFTYNYSDFRHDPIKVLNDYFDMMLYMSNWGERRLIIKFPKSLVQLSELREYEISVERDFDQYVKITEMGENVLVDFNYCNDLNSGWTNGEGILNNLLELREQILLGDYRVLYLGWLHIASEGIPNTELQEPPLPVNLNKLNYPLNQFCIFWEILEGWIQAASRLSEEGEEVPLERIQNSILALSEEEKTTFLRLLLENTTQTKRLLRKRLLEEIFTNKIQTTITNRTVMDIQKIVENGYSAEE